MEKSLVLFAIAVALLLVVAGVQAIQFNSLVSELKQAPKLSATTSPSSSGSSANNALASLPAQVGGC